MRRGKTNTEKKKKKGGGAGECACKTQNLVKFLLCSSDAK